MQLRLGLLLLMSVALMVTQVLGQAARPAGTTGNDGYLLQSCLGSSGGTTGANPKCLGAGTIGQATPSGVSWGPGSRLTSGFWTVPGGAASAAGVPTSAPLATAIGESSPNPAAGFALIQYTLAQPASVQIDVFTVSGRKVRTLVNGSHPAGVYTVNWDLRDDRGRAVEPGVYFYQLRAGCFSRVKKVVIVK
jgi:hypothetical protein